MKRFACLLLAVVLVAAMTVPVFAAPVYNSDLKYALDRVRSAINSYTHDYHKGSEFRYLAIVYWVNSNDTISITAFANRALSVFYDNTSVVKYTLSADGSKVLSHGAADLSRHFPNGFPSNAFYVRSHSNASFSFSSPPSHDWISDVYAGLPPVDKAFLTSLVNELQATENIGYTPISWTAFQNALQAAVSLLGSQSATQSQIDSAHDDLQLVFDSLVLLPDTESFESFLLEAESIKNENYTVVTWSRFQNALQSARTLLAQPSYTQEEIDAAYAELQAAMEGLTIDKPPPEESSEPDKPPPIEIGGYDVPDHVMAAVTSGNVMDIVSEFAGPFLDHAMSAFSVVIPLLGLFLVTKLIPKIFRFFVR
ncbi:MAG TPA: hypothetical protein DD738_06875 [Ruminiclostridium sp.]|nr:hypothetical protein [Ruminiclostridium sp.]